MVSNCTSAGALVQWTRVKRKITAAQQKQAHYHQLGEKNLEVLIQHRMLAAL